MAKFVTLTNAYTGRHVSLRAAAVVCVHGHHQDPGTPTDEDGKMFGWARRPLAHLELLGSGADTIPVAERLGDVLDILEQADA